jgi:uncharacterized cysteine cluster protein YcgN (CxxCxxCC family)
MNDQLCDPKGGFIFHGTYLFVANTADIELVNPACPALEGKTISCTRNSAGTFLVRDCIRLALSPLRVTQTGA